MKLTIEIEMDNDAFHGDDGMDAGASASESARILERLAHSFKGDSFEAGDSGKLRDINGNTVGRWEVSE